MKKSDGKRERWSERVMETQREGESIAVKLQVSPDNELSQCCCFHGLLTARFEASYKTHPKIFRRISTLLLYPLNGSVNITV